MVATYVALATFNGEQFIAEQIESIQAQSVTDWRLLVRDDGSTDATCNIVESYCAQDDRIEILPSDSPAGTIGNFTRLFRAAHSAGADYVFPCDQDDVWRSDKIERMLGEMNRLESVYGSATPLLVHSDLEVVDEALAAIDGSFLKYRRLRHQDDALGVLLVHNFVTGCASLYNRALLDAGLPVPGGCVMHDWWMALIAAATGRIGFVPDSLVRYRQHDSNQIGAQSVPKGPFAEKPPRCERAELADRNVMDSIHQAALLDGRLAKSPLAGNRQKAAVSAYATLLEKPPWVRTARLVRYGILPQRIPARPWSILRSALLQDNGEPEKDVTNPATAAFDRGADG